LNRAKIASHCVHLSQSAVDDRNRIIGTRERGDIQIGDLLLDTALLESIEKVGAPEEKKSGAKAKR
jgi:hypothetical protein